jgi:hypothetical protein
MGDLLLKYAESTRQEENAATKPTVQLAPTDITRKGTTVNEPKPVMSATATQQQGTKRTR